MGNVEGAAEPGELARSPDRALPRLRALHARHPDLAILSLGRKDIPSHSPTLAELLHKTKARAEAEAASPEEDASAATRAVIPSSRDTIRAAKAASAPLEEPRMRDERL